MDSRAGAGFDCLRLGLRGRDSAKEGGGREKQVQGALWPSLLRAGSRHWER